MTAATHTSEISNERAVTANVISVGLYSHDPIITNKDRDGVTRLSDEQWQQVVHLLNANKGYSSDQVTDMFSQFNWILDTGASHHMTGKSHMMSDLRTMAHVLVILADGSQRLARYEGTVVLSSNLILKSVFFLEGLETDLISVGQFLVENNCVIQLADCFLIIQDRLTRIVTGVGSRQNGTFYFRDMEFVGAVKSRNKDDYELWYKFGSLRSLPIGSELDVTCF